ncbi:hypothetical protein [Rhabdochlamydiaceae symbiont of Dictyostelium giganteum]|uniref:hypothetical protein n=1 Tax=Rhabdochlamydiaceae symbiont of Dictyostelium giganteum TaxID=3342349 RepID=UPI00384D312A
MTKDISPYYGSFNKAFPLKEKKQFIVYQEPPYHLYLYPLTLPSPSHIQEKKIIHHTFVNLDHAATQTAYASNKANWTSLSSSQKERRIYQAAHNLMPRPDFDTKLFIQEPLAQKQGLISYAVSILKQVIPSCSEEALTPLASCLFSHASSLSSFKDHINIQIQQLLNSKASSDSRKEGHALAKEMLKMYQEIQTLTLSRIEYIRPPSIFHNQCYTDHEGEKVWLSQTHPSSYDREHLDIQNGRLMLSDKGHVIYSTGRMETSRKAHQAVSKIIHQTFLSGQIKEEDLLLQEDGTYLYPFMVENLLSTVATSHKERTYVLQQQETLKTLALKPYTAVLNNGKEIQLKLKPLHFSSHANFNILLSNWGNFSFNGSDISQAFSQIAYQELEAIYQLKREKLSSALQTYLDQVFCDLKKAREPEHQWILRASISEILNIPYHVHCKSSKDRTAVAAAIRKGIHTFISLEKWRKSSSLFTVSPVTLFHNPIFREYTESALFESLPMTDQGIGMIGSLRGNTYTPNRGFDYQKSIFENRIPSFVLSERYITKTSLLKRSILVLSAIVLSTITMIAFISLLPLVALFLYLKVGNRALEILKYLFLFIATYPLKSALRQEWINRESEALKERSFFRTSFTPLIDQAAQSLQDQLEALDQTDYQRVMKWIKEGDSFSLKDPQWDFLPPILTLLVNHWQILHTLKNPSSRLKNLLKEVGTSPIMLFRYLHLMTEETLSHYASKTLIPWPVESFLPQGNKEEKLLKELVLDAPRSHYIVKTPHQRKEFSKLHNNHTGKNITEALLELSCFKNTNTVPHAIQLALTQASSLTYILSTIGGLLEESGLAPLNSSNRKYFIEEGDSTSFWLMIQEESFITDPNNSSNKLHFYYSYSFKISKGKEGQWKSAFISLSPVSTHIDTVFNEILKPLSPPSSLDEEIHKNEIAFLQREIVSLFKKYASFKNPPKNQSLLKEKILSYHTLLTENLSSYFLTGKMMTSWTQLSCDTLEIHALPNDLQSLYISLLKTSLQKLSRKEQKTFTEEMLQQLKHKAFKKSFKNNTAALLPIFKEVLSDEAFTQIETEVITK